MPIEILRPNAAGDECNITHQTGSACPLHYQNVDEASADDATTRVFVPTYTTYYRDLYGLPASSGSGEIYKITLYFRVMSQYNGGTVKGAIKSNGTVTETAEKNPYTDFGVSAWGTYSQEWATNPADSEAWEWADIDTLQIGVSLKAASQKNTSCTQVYVEVDCATLPPTFSQNAGQGILAIAQSLEARHLRFIFTGAGTLAITGGISLIKSLNRIVGQGIIAITGTLGTIKTIYKIVGQGTLWIKGRFKTTFDRILKIISIDFIPNLKTFPREAIKSRIVLPRGSTKCFNITCIPIRGSNMANFYAGETVICLIEVQDNEGNPQNPSTGIKITIVSPAGNTVIDESNMACDELGEWHYDYNSAPTDSRGTYEVQYTTIDGTRKTMARASFIIE